eukprot:12896995-Prorocentrum_lima.AAC.1
MSSWTLEPNVPVSPSTGIAPRIIILRFGLVPNWCPANKLNVVARLRFKCPAINFRDVVHCPCTWIGWFGCELRT